MVNLTNILVKMELFTKYYGHLLWISFVLVVFVQKTGGYITDPDHCVTANNRPGICVELIKCTPIVALAIDGGRPMPNYVRNKLNEEHCGFNGSQPKVCCPPIVYNSKGEGLNPYTTPITYPFVPPPNVLGHPNYHLLPTICGVMHENKVYAPPTAGIYDYPWKALIAYSKNGLVKFHCGGTIISDQYVLTAAHCLSNLSGDMYVVGVRVGESDIQSFPDCEEFHNQRHCIPKHVDYLISESFTHPEYDARTRQNDIGLLRLGNKINFTTESSRPICLPSTPELASQNFEGTSLTISGWGLNLVTEYHTSKYKHATTAILNNAPCANIYNKTPLVFSHKTLCAGGDGAPDSCNSDSGGPLQASTFVRENFRGFVQYGIVSVGPERCGVAGSPSVYTNVGYYMNWILDHMRV